MGKQDILNAHVVRNVGVPQSGSEESSAVAHGADDDGLVDGDPGLDAVAEELVDDAGVVLEPVGNEGVGPASWWLKGVSNWVLANVSKGNPSYYL